MRVLMCLLVVNMVFNVVMASSRYPYRLNDDGELVHPDDYLVFHALKSDKNGDKNDAMWKLKEAAEFGNKDAQYLAGLLHLQSENKLMGYAWLKLAGKNVGNSAHLLQALESQFTAKEFEVANNNLAELKETYNYENAIKKRLKWKNSQRFVGSRIGGFVSPMADVQSADGMVVNGHSLKSTLDDYVFNYRYDRGEVIIKDLEIIESEN